MINVRMLKKILIIILLIVSFQFIVNIPAYAADNNVLLGPVLELFARLGDGIMNIMQKTFMGMDASGVWVTDQNSLWLKILIVVAAIAIATIAVIATIYTGGAALTIISTMIGAVVKIGAGAAVAYFAVSVTHFGEGRFFLTRI